jgi:hypothetical protein
MFNFKLYPGSKDSEKIQTRFKKVTAKNEKIFKLIG